MMMMITLSNSSNASLNSACCSSDNRSIVVHFEERFGGGKFAFTLLRRFNVPAFALVVVVVERPAQDI